MAYGSSELDIAAATVDDWMNEGTNALDLFSSHNPVMAIMLDQSEQPGGEYQFKKGAPAEGNKFKTTSWGKANATVVGVTRANQVNALSSTVPTNLVTNAYWNWAHYEGVATYDYRDKVINSGKALRIDVGNTLFDQIIGTFYDTVGTDLLDGVADSEDKVLSFNSALANSTTVGGIDQSSSDNTWWQAVRETTTETLNTQTIDKAIMDATYDCGKKTGIMRMSPDIMITTSALASKLMQDLKQSQRVQVETMLKGGSRYIDYAGCRVFWTDRTTAGTVMGLNSTVWTFRYNTKAPDPVTPGWVPVNLTPAMMQRGYNWIIGLGMHSAKHNFVLANKSA